MPLDIATLRILDAAANRAREGLRVVEDYVRFVRDDAFMTTQLKALRHDLAAAESLLPMAVRLTARETAADVGTAIALPSEAARGDRDCVLAAAWSRLQESLRSLEEYAKVISAEAGHRFEQARYRSYTLQKAMAATADGCERLRDARLYVLIDGRSSETDFARLVESLVAAEANVLQLREKQLDDRTLLERARLLRRLTHGSQTLFVMNDRPDLAALAQADGVHVGQEELSVKDARYVVGPRALVGVSVHSIEQARAAVLAGASYLGVGPTFVSSTKTFSAFTGLELLRQVAAEITLPAFAIGGIDTERLADVLATGIARIAVSGAVLAAKDPAAAVHALKERLSAGPPGIPPSRLPRTMHYEVELKFPAADFAVIEARLRALGGEIGQAVGEVDRYFAHPARDFSQTDEALRVRCKGEQCCVTYKGPKLDATTKSRSEIELPLPPGPARVDEWTALLEALGFRPVAEVCKQRRKSHVAWRGRQVEISLDEVAEVGTFVELEVLASPGDFEPAKACIQSLAAELGLTGSERRSYLGMLLSKRRAKESDRAE